MINVWSNIGNVKTKFNKLNNFWKRNITAYILVIVYEEAMDISLVNHFNERIQIIKLKREYKNNEDEIFFYQEVLYRFCNELSCYKFEYVIVSYASECLLTRQITLPKMNEQDLAKAISWAIKEDISLNDYRYIYQCFPKDEMIQIVVTLMKKDFFNLWKDIVQQQNIVLLDMPFFIKNINMEQYFTDDYLCKVILDRADNERNLNFELQFIDNYIEQKSIINEYISGLIAYTNKKYISFLEHNEEPSKIKWPNIYLFLSVIIFMSIGFFTSFKYVDYYNLDKRAEVLQQRVNLIEPDLNIISALKDKQENLTKRAGTIREIEQENVNIYGLLVNLGTNTVDGVAIDQLNVDKNKVEIKARAYSYEDITKYQEVLHSLRILKMATFSDIKLDEQSKLLDFKISVIF